LRVTLDEDLEMVTAFHDLERLRFGDRLRVAWDVEPEARAKLLPPLLLLPLVENAVTHGIGTLVEGGEVAVRARLDGEHLALAIDNPRDQTSPRRPRRGGLGIDHARRRLAALFGSGAALRTREGQESFGVEIDLPARGERA
jgi:LytS/YehU family sensor histidine kinase